MASDPLPGSVGRPKVVRVYHSAVVASWRERDRLLRQSGADVVLISAKCWDEGGSAVSLEADGDTFVVGARTWGSRPNLFLYDPLPIWKVLRRHRPELLDVHEEPCSLAAAELRLLRRLLCPSARLLLYSAQNIHKRYPWPFRALERAALRAASGVYVCNRAADRIVRNKGFHGTSAVLPLGVDLSDFATEGDEPAAGGPAGLRLGYVGRLERRKGVHVILDAMADEPGWTLDIVGGGAHEAPLKEQANAPGLEGRVRFRGFVGHHALPELYRSLDVLVVPSLPTPGWEEQFCRVAVEAMASGVPVVASASGALPEVVGEGGVLFEPGDAAHLREVLRDLERDPGARTALGQRAKAWSEQFRWEAVASAHRALYDAVLR